ncbi:MAG: UDP-N-acetylglucosamine 1-carboxyvinyltransferase, partial [Candidatus Delongbacteria bacterium]
MPANDYFTVNGGRKLKGDIYASGNKNEALPVIAATLLTEDEVIIDNIPDIIDTNIMINIASDLGVKVKKLTKNSYRFQADDLKGSGLNMELSSKIRSSLLFLAPLLLRKGEVPLPSAGGDRIGARRIDSHLLAFVKLGVKIAEGKKGV